VLASKTNVLQLADFREAEMMQWGRDWLATARTCGILELDDPFNSDSMHALVRRMFANLADLHERNAARIVDLALAGAEDAGEGLKDLIAERNALGLPLGPALGTYATILADRPPNYRRPPVRPRENFFANHVIVVLLIALMRQFPDLRLRRSSSKRPSACSIVSELLIEAGIGRGSEEAIRQIWKHYGPPVTPGYGWNSKT
jgi:hypothetical protein